MSSGGEDASTGTLDIDKVRDELNALLPADKRWLLFQWEPAVRAEERARAEADQVFTRGLITDLERQKERVDRAEAALSDTERRRIEESEYSRNDHYWRFAEPGERGEAIAHFQHGWDAARAAVSRALAAAEEAGDGE